MDIVERLLRTRQFINDPVTLKPLKVNPDGEEAATEITRLRKENKRMRQALKPFADRAGKLDGKWLDHETHWSPAYGSTAITIADLRRANAALATTGGE